MNKGYLDNLFDLANKVVLMTGATGQLGFEVCKAFEKAGSTVFATDKAINTKKVIDSKQVKYFEMDITDKASIIQGMDRVYAEYDHLDVLINNAGVSCFEPYEERPEESFDWVMDVNLKGTFLCIQAYANEIKEKKHDGSIINIGSIYGLISPDFRIYTDCKRMNSEVYGATKAAVIQMTRYFAVHLARYGIRVNSVSPGGIFNTESPQGEDFVENYSYRCPMGRMANCEEMIGGILYLASSAAGYTTGQNLVIDGGMSCW
ncbi:MAG: SDR family oxidoreductase [Deltaproteobacteria bacterium]|nr:SDR family oxidoreductase [Deltaproteobacteria bacterium]MBW2116684.1 SDR family oxidoreductase [Deltaproteobacteria bacterium]MBW2342992.1 SDR family oxidoreductase [Deltaproteobacteria bacterium]